MNLQNITYMVDSLKRLGFDASVKDDIIRHILFAPEKFTVLHEAKRGGDIVCTLLYFKREESLDKYSCPYYDVSLRKEVEIPEVLVKNQSSLDLSRRMAEVDWKVVLSSCCGDSGKESKTDWSDWEKVEAIIRDLLLWEAEENGREVAIRLKVKYWSDLPGIESFCPISALKARYEIIQRFYLTEEEGISLEEAYRFLNNRWLEKRLQAKKKNEDLLGKGGPTTGNGSNGSLLPKKHKKVTNRLKIKR